ncbi:MAG: accessory factor UbiK family protein [Pseudomonadota bacterium]
MTDNRSDDYSSQQGGSNYGGGFGGGRGPNRLVDEFAKLMTDAAGMAQGVRREAETAFRSQAERIVHTMDLVSREDFDAVKAMAAQALDDNAELRKRIEALEAKHSDDK